MVGDEVVLEAVQHLLCLGKDFRGAATPHQHSLGTEHLRYLREDRAAPLPNQQVAEPTYCRIGCNPRKSIGGTAFEAYDQMLRANVLPLKSIGVGSQFLQKSFSL